MSAAQSVTSGTFEQEVIKCDIPVLVDFWAEWCGPCKALGPTIDEIAGDFAGKVKVVKLDVQNEPTVASQFGIVSIPTLLLFKNGQIVNRMVGLQPKANITQQLNAAL